MFNICIQLVDLELGYLDMVLGMLVEELLTFATVYLRFIRLVKQLEDQL